MGRTQILSEDVENVDGLFLDGKASAQMLRRRRIHGVIITTLFHFISPISFIRLVAAIPNAVTAIANPQGIEAPSSLH
jgi:hypothetical protein